MSRRFDRARPGPDWASRYDEVTGKHAIGATACRMIETADWPLAFLLGGTCRVVANGVREAA